MVYPPPPSPWQKIARTPIASHADVLRGFVTRSCPADVCLWPKAFPVTRCKKIKITHKYSAMRNHASRSKQWAPSCVTKPLYLPDETVAWTLVSLCLKTVIWDLALNQQEHKSREKNHEKRDITECADLAIQVPRSTACVQWLSHSVSYHDVRRLL